MSAGGFYLMHRGWMENPIFDNEPYTSREAWEWLIQRAAWDDAVHVVGRRRVAVKCGQLAVARRYLAQQWQWSKSTADRFLQRLVDGGMIEADARTDFTIITVRNYRLYQYRAGEGGAPAPDADVERGPQVGRVRAANRATARAAGWAADGAAEDAPAVRRNESDVNEVETGRQITEQDNGPEHGPQDGPHGGTNAKCNPQEKRANYNENQENKENNTSLAARADADADAAAVPAAGSPDRAALADFASWLEGYLNLARPIALDQIRLWLGRGVTLDQLRQVITDLTGRNRENNPAWRPYSLRYYDAAIERFRRNPVPPVPVDPMVSQWRMRLERYKANGTWVPNWGDPPEQADCVAPRALLIEFGFRQGA